MVCATSHSLAAIAGASALSKTSEPPAGMVVEDGQAIVRPVVMVEATLLAASEIARGREWALMRANVEARPSQPNSADVHADGFGGDDVVDELDDAGFELDACSDAVCDEDGITVDFSVAVFAAVEFDGAEDVAVGTVEGVIEKVGAADALAPRPLSVASMRLSCC